MSFTSFVLVFISVSISALAQTAFKIGVSRVPITPDMGVLQKAAGFLLSSYVIGGLVLYGIGTVLWLFALKQLDLSLAYPFVAMSFVMVMLSGMILLGEPFQTSRVVGIALIIAGLLVMARG